MINLFIEVCMKTNKKLKIKVNFNALNYIHRYKFYSKKENVAPHPQSTLYCLTKAEPIIPFLMYVFCLKSNISIILFV